jgi:tRNA (cytidine/uridine-2'-O-)-methyltransferase
VAPREQKERSVLCHLVLDRPRIAANIGAVVRLAAATDSAVHICGPLVFEEGDTTRWRAGLDYWGGTRVHFHRSLERCLRLLGGAPWLVEVGGQRAPWDVSLGRGDVFVFGSETGSLPESLLAAHPEGHLTLPQEEAVRSMNLAQCAAVMAFECLRQSDLHGLQSPSVA